jgi:hypothetical protein
LVRTAELDTDAPPARKSGYDAPARSSRVSLEAAMNERPNQELPRAQVFRRELPGGGYVVIGVEPPAGDRSVARTCVWVERRESSDRTSGHEAPVIATADGDERSAGFTEMYRLAADNAAVARGLMQWRATKADTIQRAD